MSEPKTKSKLAKPKIVGWREIVALPALGISAIKAKMDTGARTSALHALNQDVFEKDGAKWVSFHVPIPGTPHKSRCEAPVIDERPIKNTSGIPERRLVIKTPLVIGKRHWVVEVSLADRERMEFDLILGRTAIRRRGYMVDPRRSFLAGDPQFSARDLETLRTMSK